MELRKHLFLLLWVLTGCAFPRALHCQGLKLSADKSYQAVTVGFYNLENLFDTLDTPHKEDSEFLPGGAKRYGTKRYYEKLGHLAEVISKAGTGLNPDGLAMLGVSEMENKAVLKDLVNQKVLQSRGYKIIHYESPDERGIDVALLFNPKYFSPAHEDTYRLNIKDKEDFNTRDQLVVTGDLLGEEISVLVNHWPSRSGGEKSSRPYRKAAARLNRSIIDSLFEEDQNAKLITMGDLNDDPTNASVRVELNAMGNAKKAKRGKLFNPMYGLYKKGIGSLAYHDNWNLFDQTIISEAWLHDDATNWRYYGAKVYNKDYLKQKSGNFKGYPNRTYVGNTYMGGYSDHFLVYLILVREAKSSQ